MTYEIKHLKRQKKKTLKDGLKGTMIFKN